MRERTRWALIAVASAMALLTGASLIALRAGRPLFYSDGEQTHYGAGADLRDAPMLLWGRPEPEAELVGEVRGRVATLPDGSVVYGRAQGRDRTELVHAPRAGAEPVTIGALASAGHDLAPTLAPDGRTLYFASDRAHGSGGGYDLWQARYDGRGFYPPTPIVGAVATAGDEVDPVLDPRTGELVFARRTAGEAWFRLWTVPLDDSRAPEMLLPAPPWDAAASEREPAFAPDGASLWFVRRAGDGPIELAQAFRHAGRFVTPTVVGALRQAGALRAPEVLDDGRSLRLLDAERGLLYRARAAEVYPWWEGQRALEQTLLVLLIVSLLILALLILGRRWRALDVVTWCLIASVLLHLAILLWLRGVEIVRRYQAPDPRPGQMEVTLVAAGSQADASASASGSLVAEVQFASQTEALQVAAPDATAPDAERVAPRATEAERAAEAPSASAAALEAASLEADVHDAPLPDAVRAERAVADQLTPASGVIDARVAALEVARPAAGDAGKVVVEVPGTANAALSAAVVGTAPEGERHEAVPVAHGARHAPASAEDTPVGAPPRAAVASATPAMGALRVGVAPRQVTPGVERVSLPLPAGGVEVAGAPPSEFASVRVWVLPAGRAELASPQPQSQRQVPPRLADAPGPLPERTDARAAAATPSLAMAVEPTLSPRMGEATEVRRPDVPGGSDLAPATPDSGLVGAASASMAAGGRAQSVRARPMAVRGPALVDAPTGLAAAATASSTASAPAATPSLTEGPLGQLGPTTTAVPRVARSSPDVGGGGASVALPESVLGLAGGVAAAGGARASSPLAARGPVLRRPTLADAAGGSPAEVRPLRATAAPALDAVQGARLSAAAPAVIRPSRQSQAATALRDLSRGLELPESTLPIPPTDWMAVAGMATRAIPEFYRNRFGPQKVEALERFGGTPETEAAVSRGLAYLARIQQADGGWGRRRRDHDKYGEVQVGKSALCLLALLGAGHTPKSGTAHAQNSEAAVRWLLDQQDPDTGHFGDTSSYSHGITTYALAECFAMTKDERLRAPLERAVAWIVKNQNRTRDRRNFGGWPYFSASRRPEDRYARTSITAWMVMALESARMSGLEVGAGVLEDAKTFLWGMFDTEHDSFLYNKEPSRLASEWRALPGSTPAAVFCLLLTGADPDDPRLRAALAWTLERAPGEYRRYRDDDFVLRGSGNVYYWYYGSLACFLAGGEVWSAWNSALKESLLDGQDIDGSFPLIDVYAEYAGDTDRDRAYTTAMCVLSLEAYYRYFTPLVKPRSPR